MKTIEGIRYKKNGNGIYFPIEEGLSTRRKSWITMYQIGNEYPEFIDKIAEVLYHKEYNAKAKDFARNVLNFLYLWQFVTWKQFDSILSICARYDDFKRAFDKGTGYFRTGELITFKRAKAACTVRYMGTIPVLDTDRSYDKFHEKMFGIPPLFEEEIEEGLVRKYRDDGSRYFAFPTEADMKDALDDFIMSTY
jgi:hypothetical protein